MDRLFADNQYDEQTRFLIKKEIIFYILTHNLLTSFLKYNEIMEGIHNANY